MKIFTPIAILSFLLLSCKQEKMTLEDLQKAKWTQLTHGIDYISTQKASNGASEKDSIIVKLIGIQEGETLIESYINNVDSAITDFLSNNLKEHLIKSKAGYLKINLTEILKPPSLTGQVYLRGDYGDAFHFSEDSVALLQIPGIMSALYISKEDAKKNYLSDGNDDWSEVLTENPLPNAIEITLENKKWTQKLLEELDSLITEKLPMASDFVYSSLLFEESLTYYLFEYKRI